MVAVVVAEPEDPEVGGEVGEGEEEEEEGPKERLCWRWYRNTECRRESAEPSVSKRTTVSALTSARMWRMLMRKPDGRTRMVGTTFGTRESILRRSRGW